MSELSIHNCVAHWVADETNGVLDGVIAENAKLRELARDSLMLTEDTDCYGCRYDKHTDCEHGYECTLLRRARELGIEVDE